MAQRKAPNGPDNCVLSARLIFWILRKSKATSRRMSGLPDAVSEQLRLPLLVAEDGRWPFFSPQAPESQLWSEAGFYHHSITNPSHYRIESKKSSNMLNMFFNIFQMNSNDWFTQIWWGFSMASASLITIPGASFTKPPARAPRPILQRSYGCPGRSAPDHPKLGHDDGWPGPLQRGSRWLEGHIPRVWSRWKNFTSLIGKYMRNHPGPFSIAMWNYRRLCTEIGFCFFPLKSKAFVSRTADAPPGKSQDV